MMPVFRSPPPVDADPLALRQDVEQSLVLVAELDKARPIRKSRRWQEWADRTRNAHRQLRELQYRLDLAPEISVSLREEVTNSLALLERLMQAPPGPLRSPDIRLRSGRDDHLDMGVSRRPVPEEIPVFPVEVRKL